MMKFQKVNSSSISELGYDEETKEMIILFMNGIKYLYKDFPIEVYKNLLFADSKGAYFSRYIRPLYKQQKI